MAEEGEYSNHYDTLRPMGKGAFGFVRMAQRRDDGTAVRASVHEYRPILTLYGRKSLIRTSVIQTPKIMRYFIDCALNGKCSALYTNSNVSLI